MSDEAPRAGLKLSPSASQEQLICALLVSSLPLFYLLYDLILFRNDISSWLAMRISGVQLLLKEQKLYVDFWDWTQPIVFDCMRGPLALRQLLEQQGLFLPVDLFSHVLIWFTVLCSCLLTGLVFSRAMLALEAENDSSVKDSVVKGELRQLIVPLMFSTALTALIIRFDFGDLPLFLVLALAPWSLLRWLAYRGVSLSPWLAMPVGALAGVAACFDLPFIFFFIAVELALAMEKGSLRPLLSLDTLALTLVLGLNLIHLNQLDEPSYTAFWKWTMALKLANYQIYDGSLYGPDSCPDRRDILYGMALSLGLAFILGKKNSFFLPAVTILLAGFSLFVLEKQGLSRDLIPAVFASTLCLTMALVLALRDAAARLLPQSELKSLAQIKVAALLLGALAATATFAYCLNFDRDRMHEYVAHHSEQGYDDLLTVYNNSKVWKAPVMVICDYPQAAYPSLLNLGAEPAGYLLWSRPLRLFDWLSHHQLLSPQLKEFYAYVCQKLNTELKSGNANLIIVESMENDMLAHAGLMPSLEARYKKGDECRYYSYNRQPREFVGRWYFDAYGRKP